MEHTTVLPSEQQRIRTLTMFAGLLAVATIAPMLIHQQFITGPIVNAVLFLAVAYLGTQNAMLIGLFPSVIALTVGTLPAVLAPMVPFIIIGNTLLVLAFSVMQKKHYWQGVLVASAVKFAFLYATSSLVINLLMQKTVAMQVSAMMNWPQLITALMGGILAYLVLHLTRQTHNSHTA
ncbi:MAG: ECF transporter S component [Patescibacteria group bacterium]|jgi:MFS family permease